MAGTVRARALVGRRIGREAAAALARQADLPGALAALSAGPYGRTPYGRELRPGVSRARAERALDAGALWHLRVLAGWLPAEGAELLRAMAGRYEAANIEDRLAALEGAEVDPPFELGALASAWRRGWDASEPAALRSALAASAWGDPGPLYSGEAGFILSMAWARRLADLPGGADWGAGLAALLVAGVPAGQTLPGPARIVADRLLGRDWDGAGSLPELAAAVPRTARWALSGVADASELWRAQVRWWDRLESDGLAARTITAGPGPEPVVGAAAALVADAWRAGAALEAAARGGDPELAGALG